MKKNIKSSVALLAALVGLAIYLISSLTGFLADKALDFIPVICTVAAMAAIVLGDMKPGLVKDILLIVGGLLLIVAFAQFAMSRVYMAADVYFIPVNYPAAEADCLHLSIAGLAFYLISIVTVAVKAFSAKE